MPVFLPVECPHCHSTDIAKHGKSSYNGKTRYRCCNPECPHPTFSLKLDYPGRNPNVKKQILEMTFNGSGVRDISRALGVSTSTVIKELKKSSTIEAVNSQLLNQLECEEVEVEIRPIEEAEEVGEEKATQAAGIQESELDEMWSFVGSKKNQRWLWQAIDRISGKVLAFVFGRRKDEVFLKLKELLKPFGLNKYCTDGWGAYEGNLPVEQHEIGKKKTPRIEQKHLTLRTRIKRLARKTICFSKSEEMHDLVRGLFINRYEERNQCLES